MSNDENFKEPFDYSFLNNVKSICRVNFYASTSETATLTLPEVPGSRFYGEGRPESECNDLDREKFKKPFDWSFLNND